MVYTRVFRQGVCLAVLCYMTFLPGGTLSFSAEREAEIASVSDEDQAGPGGVTRAQLRHEVMRFSRRLLDTVAQASDDIEMRAPTPRARLAAHEGKLTYGASAVDIAIGPNPEVNLLDMVVFVTLARIVVEEYWVPQVFGEAGRGLLKAFRALEADIWAIASRVLTPEQQQDLRNLIQEWRKSHPDQVYVEGVRFGDFSEHIGKSTLADAQRSGGLFGVKGVKRAVDEVRLLSERLIFYMQVVPFLTRWQAKQLFFEIAAAPEIPTLLTDVRQTLSAGTALASQINTTVGSVDRLVARMHARREEPTDIKDIQKVLQQSIVLTKSVEQLLTSSGWDKRQPQLVELLERFRAGGEQLVNRTESEGEEWVDFAFRRTILLIVIFFATMLAYRFASAKLIGSRRARGPS